MGAATSSDDSGNRSRMCRSWLWRLCPAAAASTCVLIGCVLLPLAQADTSCANLNVGFDIDSSDVVRRGTVQPHFALGAAASQQNSIGSDADKTFLCAFVADPSRWFESTDCPIDGCCSVCG